MSVLPSFEQDVLDLFSQKSLTSEFYLTPVNTIILQDANGNVVATVTDVEVTYSNGVLEITGEFEAPVSDTVTTILIGSTYQGVFKAYFQVTGQNIQVSQGNVYEVKATVDLNNASLQLSPFPNASVDVNRLVDIIGNILANNPLYVGKKGHFFDAIYVVNTTSNVSQSYRIPITILTVEDGVLFVGGVASMQLVGNQIVLRDNNQNDLIKVSSSTPITIKKGRQIVFEISF